LFATSEPVVALRPQDHHVDAPQLLAPLFGMMPAEPAHFQGRVHTTPSSNDPMILLVTLAYSAVVCMSVLL
jgi:hypothetical protein